MHGFIPVFYCFGRPDLNWVVYSLALDGGVLYAGGSFTDAGGDTDADNIAQYNIAGGTWSAVGTGTNGGVFSIVIDGTNLYADCSYELRSPKTFQGIRNIGIGKDVIEILRFHQNEISKNDSCEDSDWNKLNLVFPSLTGTPVNASNLRRSFRRLLKSTGLPKIRFHDLRHTAATLMLNFGTPLPIVSQRLGHSKVSMTLDIYAHAIPSK
jgi:integrase